jgi:L-asparaginase
MTDNYRDKIVIVALGGTIAMVPGNTPGAVPRLSAEDLAAAVPALVEYPIEPVSFLQKSGAHLTF